MPKVKNTGLRRRGTGNRPACESEGTTISQNTSPKTQSRGSRLCSELRNLPLVSIDEGKELGRIGSFLVDPDKRCIEAYILSTADVRAGVHVVALNAISSYGSFALTIAQKSAIMELTSVPEFMQLFEKDIILLGTEVNDSSGKLMGFIKDVSFDASDGSILLLKITSDTGFMSPYQATVPISAISSIEKDRIVINEEYKISYSKDGPISGTGKKAAFVPLVAHEEELKRAMLNRLQHEMEKMRRELRDKLFEQHEEYFLSRQKSTLEKSVIESLKEWINARISEAGESAAQQFTDHITSALAPLTRGDQFDRLQQEVNDLRAELESTRAEHSEQALQGIQNIRDDIRSQLETLEERLNHDNSERVQQLEERLREHMAESRATQEKSSGQEIARMVQSMKQDLASSLADLDARFKDTDADTDIKIERFRAAFKDEWNFFKTEWQSKIHDVTADQISETADSYVKKAEALFEQKLTEWGLSGLDQKLEELSTSFRADVGKIWDAAENRLQAVEENWKIAEDMLAGSEQKFSESQEKLATLQNKLDDLGATLSQTTSTQSLMESKLDTSLNDLGFLKTALETIEEIHRINQEKIDTLDTRIDSVAQQSGITEEKSGEAVSKQALAIEELDKKIAAIEKNTEAVSRHEQSLAELSSHIQMLNGLQENITALEQSMEQSGETINLLETIGALEEKFENNLKETVGTLEKKVENTFDQTRREQEKKFAGNLQETISTLKQEVENHFDETNKSLEEKLKNDLDQRIESLEEKLESAPASDAEIPESEFNAFKSEMEERMSMLLSAQDANYEEITSDTAAEVAELRQAYEEKSRDLEQRVRAISDETVAKANSEIEAIRNKADQAHELLHSGPLSNIQSRLDTELDQISFQLGKISKELEARVDVLESNIVTSDKMEAVEEKLVSRLDQKAQSLREEFESANKQFEARAESLREEIQSAQEQTDIHHIVGNVRDEILRLIENRLATISEPDISQEQVAEMMDSMAAMLREEFGTGADSVSPDELAQSIEKLRDQTQEKMGNLRHLLFDALEGKMDELKSQNEAGHLERLVDNTIEKRISELQERIEETRKLAEQAAGAGISKKDIEELDDTVQSIMQQHARTQNRLAEIEDSVPVAARLVEQIDDFNTSMGGLDDVEKRLNSKVLSALTKADQVANQIAGLADKKEFNKLRSQLEDELRNEMRAFEKRLDLIIEETQKISSLNKEIAQETPPQVAQELDGFRRQLEQVEPRLLQQAETRLRALIDEMDIESRRHVRELQEKVNQESEDTASMLNSFNARMLKITAGLEQLSSRTSEQARTPAQTPDFRRALEESEKKTLEKIYEQYDVLSSRLDKALRQQSSETADHITALRDRLEQMAVSQPSEPATQDTEHPVEIDDNAIQELRQAITILDQRLEQLRNSMESEAPAASADVPEIPDIRKLVDELIISHIKRLEQAMEGAPSQTPGEATHVSGDMAALENKFNTQIQELRKEIEPLGEQASQAEKALAEAQEYGKKFKSLQKDLLMFGKDAVSRKQLEPIVARLDKLQETVGNLSTLPAGTVSEGGGELPSHMQESIHQNILDSLKKKGLRELIFGSENPLAVSSEESDLPQEISETEASEIFGERLLKKMLGRRVKKDIYTDDNRCIIRKGETVDEELIKKAKAHGKFLELSLHVSDSRP